MRIAHYLDGTGHGGDAVAALLLAEGQVASGDRAVILISESDHAAEFVERVAGRVPASILAGVRHDGAQPRRQRVVALARALRAARADVVHVHTGGLAVHGIDAVACRLVRPRRLVATMHGAITWADYPDPEKWQDRWRRAAQLFQAVTVPTRWALQQQQAASLRASMLHVVPNPVALVPARAARADVLASVGVPADAEGVVMFIGRLEPVKGVTDLVDAFAAVTGRRPGWHLVVVGSGSLEGPLRAGAAARDHSAVIHLAGYRADVADLLAVTDVFVNPSYAESFGMSVIEAMVAGCAVMSTPVGVVPDLRSDRPAVAPIQAGDTGALADELAALLADPARRAALADAGRAVATGYEPRAVAERFKALYEGRATPPV